MTKTTPSKHRKSTLSKDSRAFYTRGCIFSVREKNLQAQHIQSNSCQLKLAFKHSGTWADSGSKGDDGTGKCYQETDCGRRETLPAVMGRQGLDEAACPYQSNPFTRSPLTLTCAGCLGAQLSHRLWGNLRGKPCTTRKPSIHQALYKSQQNQRSIWTHHWKKILKNTKDLIPIESPANWVCVSHLAFPVFNFLLCRIRGLSWWTIEISFILQETIIYQWVKVKASLYQLYVCFYFKR